MTPEFDLEMLRPSSLDALTSALGDLPQVKLAGAHVYPAAAPAYSPAPRLERPPRSLEQLRLYVHVPFCNYHCSFCHYATRTGDDRAQQERYVAALRRELEWAPAGTPLSQLFMGGGTPTVLAPDLLDALLAAIFERTPTVPGQVHTVEASPESVEPAHLEVLRARGVGRVSMGVQSLDEGVLAGVQRRHDRETVLRACERIVGSGLILNVDLMYGLPGQSPESFLEDLETVAGRGVHSVTLYDLRVSERSPVGRSLAEGERLDLARLLAWRRFVKDAAAEHGFSQVRWHTFKRLDTIAARHERAACFDEQVQGFQLGIGMSARSHLGTAIFRNHVRMGEYVRRIEAGESPVEDVFELGPLDVRTQLVARTLGDGRELEWETWERAFGATLESDFGPVIERLAEVGLIETDARALRLTELGRLLHDRVMVQFYPSHAVEWLRRQAA